MPAMSVWRERLARAAYSAALILATPLYLIKLWRRGRAEPPYRQAVGERLGRYRGERMEGAVWVHAVSLGETRAAGALIDALRAVRPGMRLLLTHGTATGREAGAALLRPGDVQAWLPYDTPGAVARFLAHFAPAVGVLMETEIWPNLLHAARERGVPMVLANARLSERSSHQGQRLAVLLRPAAQSLALVLAQTEADARRLREAGARQVQVSGNLKFDMAPDEALLGRGREWQARAGRPVILMAASREGEEDALLAAWAQQTDAQAARPLLVVVPRHPQRFDDVAARMAATGAVVVRRSGFGEAPSIVDLNADLWLGDSMGEMPLYYALADVALLGGSFAPLGGQNLIEAAACGCPIVMGPHTFNFAEAAELSLAAGAAQRVDGMGEGVAAALAMAGDEKRRMHAARQARDFAGQHRGAAVRMAQAIAASMAGQGSAG
jgi:3-deoxy-D-manno-octulosonic-acid transferase